MRRLATLVMCAALLYSCGTGRSGIRQGAKGSTPATAELQVSSTDTVDYNTRLRLRYFYEEAANEQALGHYDTAYELLMHCKEIDPNAAEVHFALSSYDDGLNSQAMAIADVRKAAELNPDNSTYQERLAIANVQTGDYDSAIKAYEKLYSGNPERTDVLSILMQLYDKQKNYDKMISTVQRMEDADGESEKTVLTKMHIYSQQGKKKEEYRTLKAFVDRYPNDLSYQVMLGNWLIANNQKAQALSVLQKVLKEDPENMSAQLSMIDYYKAEKLDSIANQMQERLLLMPQTPTATKVTIIRQIIADNEAAGADSTKVLSLFSKILSREQKEADMAEVYAAYLSLKKMPDDSIANALRRVLDISPDNKGARIELIRMLWGKTDFKDIIQICKPAVEYNPDELAFYYFLGFAYVQEDESEKALDVFRKGVAQATDGSEPSFVSDMYSYIGDLLHSKGDIEGAYAAFDSCLQWKEDNVECLNNYAYYISESGGDLTRAEQMSYKTIKAEPKNGTYLDTYAWILFMEKRYSEAQIYIEQAIANDTTNNYVLLDHAGDIYIMLGEPDKAIDKWKKAIEAGGDASFIERKIRQRKYIPSNM